MDKGDIKKWDLVRNPVAPGQVRPDVKRDQDRGAADSELRQNQARAGEVPQPKLGEKLIEVAHSTPLPPVPTQNPISEKIAPRTPPPETHAESGHHQSATTTSHSEAPTTETLEQRVLAGKDAAKNLANLTQGMKAAAETLGQKIVAATHVATHAATAAANLLPKAFWTPRTAEGLAKKSPVPVTTPKQFDAPQAKTAQGTREQPTGRAGEVHHAHVAAAIAQKVPSPFASEPRAAGREESKTSERGGIDTDEAAANALDNVVTGRPVTAVASHGFSAGSHHGGFGDPEGESAGLAGRVGSAPNLPIILDDTETAVETIALYAGLGLTRLLYGAQELLQRAIPVDQRMANTQDDTPFILRVKGSARDHQQMAEGTRGSVYGPGRMIG